MTSIEITFLKLNRARVVSENAAMHINKVSSYIIDNPNFPGSEPKFFDRNLFGFEYHFPVQNHLESISVGCFYILLDICNLILSFQRHYYSCKISSNYA